MFVRIPVLAIGLAACLSLGADWPQWLGPNRNNVSSEIVPPWSGAPTVHWRLPVGEGNGGPVISNGRVFLLTKVKGKDVEEVMALDATTGKEIWRTAYDRPEFTSMFGNGPRSTPTVVDGKVYTMGITGILSCFDAADGKILWQANPSEEFKAARLVFGSAVSPLVEGGKVYVMAGGKGGVIAAYDAGTGKLVWSEKKDQASYSSPIAIGQGADREIIFLAQSGIVALSPTDGTVLWRAPLVDGLMETSSTPAICGDVLLASSITFGAMGLDLKKEDGKQGKKLWTNPALTCYFATPVAVGTDHFYVVTGTKPPARNMVATLQCVEAKTGKLLWKRPNVGKYHASLMCTGDDKLLMLEESGDLVLLQADPKEYRELSRTKVCGETWAHPALANGRFYVRDNKEMVCFSLGK
ncbi:MAG TPA: PQQ-binding-like beta-propeller repeat protein [Gemmataceae bacterium]|jgi:outer membrane protein assembly factor BamB|nr:PQQ-binding-like beta-propeller repeat protein [Gemmataceae bacterium]